MAHQLGVDKADDIVPIRFLSRGNQLDRAGVYIDGFNLYHAIDDLGEDHLKWCNYWKLGEALIRPGETLQLVKVATAYHPDSDKKIRHSLVNTALENVGVTILRGHYVEEKIGCEGCSRVWVKRTEKEGDINLAIALIDDAHMNQFDVAYLVTSDTDQAATARLFKARFPGKRLISTSPPDRSHSQDITRHCSGTARITKPMLEQNLFEKYVAGTGGRVMAKRPPKYDPPEGWNPPGVTPPKTKE